MQTDTPTDQHDTAMEPRGGSTADVDSNSGSNLGSEPHRPDESPLVRSVLTATKKKSRVEARLFGEN